MRSVPSILTTVTKAPSGSFHLLLLSVVIASAVPLALFILQCVAPSSGLRGCSCYLAVVRSACKRRPSSSRTKSPLRLKAETKEKRCDDEMASREYVGICILICLVGLLTIDSRKKYQCRRTAPAPKTKFHTASSLHVEKSIPFFAATLSSRPHKGSVTSLYIPTYNSSTPHSRLESEVIPGEASGLPTP